MNNKTCKYYTSGTTTLTTTNPTIEQNSLNYRCRMSSTSTTSPVTTSLTSTTSITSTIMDHHHLRQQTNPSGVC